MESYDGTVFTARQLAGQRLMVGFEGTEANDRLRYVITELGVGGLVLFKRNIENPRQLHSLCDEAQTIAANSGQPPLLIAIDQEGGPVARLGPPFTVFPGNKAIGKTESRAAAKEFGDVSAKELKAAGINLNFAPVLDVVPEGLSDPIMGDRVFGTKPELVAELGCIVIESLQAGGVAATAKHFPGIGRTTLDSHLDLPVLDADQGLIEKSDMVPFREAIRCGVKVVMLSHIVYSHIDSQWPAGLSKGIAKDLLRGRLGFEGVTVTDDLDMGAIHKHFGVNTFVERICDSEVDIALICHDEDKMERSFEALTTCIVESEETRARAIRSVGRILSLKSEFAAKK